MRVVSGFGTYLEKHGEISATGIVIAGLRVILALSLLLGPALSLAGIRQVKPEIPQSQAAGGTSVSVLNFQDESDTGATDELGRWLGSYLAKHLSFVSKQELTARFFDWRNDASSIKEWTTDRLVRHGRKVRAQFVVRAGLLAAASENLPGKRKTRIQFYADVVWVDPPGSRRLEVEGIGYQYAGDGDRDLGIAWDSVDVRSKEFAGSSVQLALRNAIERLAEAIHQEILSSLSEGTLSSAQEPSPNQSLGATVEPPIQSGPQESSDDGSLASDIQQAQADADIQQLMAQAQECLNSVNATREKLEALVQALQALTSALQSKAQLLESGGVTETGRVDAVIDAQAQGLQDAVDQILPDSAAAASSNEDLPVESAPASGGWFDRVTRAVDFGFSVFERILDIRDRLRGIGEDPYAGASYPGGQYDPGGQYGPGQTAGDAPFEEPFVEVDGTVSQEDGASQGRLSVEEPRALPAILRTHDLYAQRLGFAGSSPASAARMSMARAGYSSPVGTRRRPLAGAEVIEPDSGVSALTDSRGYYSLQVPARSRRLIVRVGRTQVAERRLRLIGGRATPTDFVVRSDSRESAADGARILPSRVVVNRDGTNTGTLQGVVQDGQGRPVGRALVDLGSVASARTDSQGRFSFTKAPAGSERLTASAAGLKPISQPVRIIANRAGQTVIRFESSDRPTTQRDRLIVTGAGTVLSGAVTDGQNHPVPGARVSAIPLSGAAVSAAAAAGANGRFELRDLRAGTYRVLIDKVGYERRSRTVTVHSGSVEPLNVTLNRDSRSPFRPGVEEQIARNLGEIHGQVRAANGTPVANGTVELTGTSRTSGGGTARTNHNGQYSVRAIAGSYELKVRAGKLGEASRPVTLLARDSREANLTLSARNEVSERPYPRGDSNSRANDPRAAGKPDPRTTDPRAGGKPDPRTTDLRAGGKPDPRTTDPRAGGKPDPRTTDPRAGGKPDPRTTDPRAGSKPDPRTTDPRGRSEPDSRSTDPRSGRKPYPRSTSDPRDDSVGRPRTDPRTTRRPDHNPSTHRGGTPPTLPDRRTKGGVKPSPRAAANGPGLTTGIATQPISAAREG